MSNKENKIFKVPIHTDIFKARSILCAINGPTLSGKTTLLLHLLERMAPFDNIVFFTANPSDDKFERFLARNRLYKDKRTGKNVIKYNKDNVKIIRWNKNTFKQLIRCQQNTLKEIKQDIEDGKKGNYPLKYLPRIAVIFEDMSKPTEIFYVIKDIIVWSRNININLIVLSQYGKMMARPQIRNNFNIIFCKRLKKKEIKGMYEELNTDLSLKQFEQVFKYLTQTIDHGTIVFNNLSKKETIEFIKTGKY